MEKFDIKNWELRIDEILDNYVHYHIVVECVTVGAMSYRKETNQYYASFNEDYNEVDYPCNCFVGITHFIDEIVNPDNWKQ